MAVMFVFSTDTFAAEHTGEVLWHVVSALAPHVTYAQYTLLHFLTRKAAHLTDYAILACLLLRAFRQGQREPGTGAGRPSPLCSWRSMQASMSITKRTRSIVLLPSLTACSIWLAG